MANLFRKTYTRALPEGAEVFARRGKELARWTDGRGRTQTAQLSPDWQGVIVESPVWYARYRDADGVEQRKSTGCRDEQAARQVLANLLAGVEKVRSGILSPEEGQAARHAARPLAEHFADYLDYLKAKTVRGRKVSAEHRCNVDQQLSRLAGECGFRRISDIARHRVIRWMNAQADATDIAPRTVNTHRAALVAFCNWAVKNQRLTANPLEGLSKADESEVRRRRRALTPEEVAALLQAAATRPLRDALTIRRGKRKGQQAAKVSDAQRKKLARLGRERALIYKTMIYTGLRKGELASLTVSALHLDGNALYAALAGKNAKSGRGARIPIRRDLADELRGYLADELADFQRSTLADGRMAFPHELPADMKLFSLPRDLIRVFDRDLVAAGLAREVTDASGKTRIDKTDGQGRTIDVHCLRHTFATMLSQAGVAPRMAQELLRHSDIRLTMNTYTHLQLADTAGAVEALPDLPAPEDRASRQVRTGTDGRMIGAEIGAERQENRGASRQRLASRHDWPGPTDRPKTPANREQERPPSFSDKGRRKAGEEIRTLNIQLGRLTL